MKSYKISLYRLENFGKQFSGRKEIWNMVVLTNINLSSKLLFQTNIPNKKCKIILLMYMILIIWNSVPFENC